MAENGMRGGGIQVANTNTDMANGHEKDNTTNDNDKTSTRMNETTQKYVQDLLAERARMENHFPLAMKLIDEALERVKLTGRIPNREQYADVYQQRTIKLSQKVHVPIKDKKFNYVGKLLGPKGNSLRRLQEETQCKIVILGRFSMKDRVREEELRNSADPKYAHLNLPLHVEVSTIAPPAEAYARIAYALAQIRRYLIPDKHDDIRQEQFRELMEDPEAAKKITIRQQQQQQHQQQHGAGGSGNNHYRGNGQYRPKFHHQMHHHNDETVYYRSHNNAYHQQKQYVPPSQRSNTMHTTIPPQAIVGTTPAGMVMNAATYNGRNHFLNNNNGLGGGASGGGANNVSGGGGPGNMRYRPNGPYQYVKK